MGIPALKPKQLAVLFALVAGLTAIVFTACFPARVPLVAQLTHQHRPAPQLPTISSLPDFPGIPLLPRLLPKRKREELVQKILNNKIGTYPAASSRANRTGKFTTTGIFGNWPPTEEQIQRMAPNYDNVLFGADNKNLNPANNINGIDSDPNGDKWGYEIFSLQSPPLTLNENYARKVVDTLNDPDHVLFEIVNEANHDSRDFQ